MKIPETKTTHLVLFFTRNVSLEIWHKHGMLEREVAPYNAYIDEGIQVSFLTYGNLNEYAFQSRIPNVNILCNRWNLPSPLYCILIPILHARVLQRATIYKTNQLFGAGIAVLSSRVWKKPIIIRCGYLLSEFTAIRNKHRLNYVQKIKRRERKLFSSASGIIVASRKMCQNISKIHGVPETRISVIPNQVLTEIFRPGVTESSPNRICFVGRFTEQKNILSLVEACFGIDLMLVLIGDGLLRDEIRTAGCVHDVRVKFLGILPHTELPVQLCMSTIYAHVSFYEGSPPKSLLEAMSCGLPVIGSNVGGINDVIRHGENGWLSGTSPKEIREAIQTVMSDAGLRKRMGRNARQTIIETYSLAKTVEKEMNILTTY